MYRYWISFLFALYRTSIYKHRGTSKSIGIPARPLSWVLIGYPWVWIGYLHIPPCMSMPACSPSIMHIYIPMLTSLPLLLWMCLYVYLCSFIGPYPHSWIHMPAHWYSLLLTHVPMSPIRYTWVHWHVSASAGILRPPMHVHMLLHANLPL